LEFQTLPRECKLTRVIQFIIDSAASFNLGVPKGIPPSIEDKTQKPAVLLFSAGSPEALKIMVKRHAQYLLKHPERLSNVAYTLADRRERLKYRAFSVSDGTEELADATAVTCQEIEQAAFVFTGQGAQW
jgi:acyl transferase domain-containing protein